jgi:nucleoid-associated protein YgaU
MPPHASHFTSTPRIALGLLALVALWIGVYWWWPTAQEPRGISFSTPPVAVPSSSQTTQDESDRSKNGGLGPQGTDKQAREDQPGKTPTAEPAQAEKPKVTVIPPQFLEHIVQPGETYATISLKYFGTSAYSSSIARANPLMSPTSLKPGRAVRVPKDPKNIQGITVTAKEAPRPGESLFAEYIVESGDTLGRIAERVYGDSRLSKLIFDANRNTMQDEDSLKIGQKLVIPPKPVEAKNE